MGNINKKVKAIHKQLDKHLEEVILKDCEKVGDLYFELYQPKMNRVSEIIEEIYEIPRMTTDEYDVYFYEYTDIITDIQGVNRKIMMNKISERVFNESSKEAVDYMIEFLVRELARIGVDRNRCSIEVQKAHYRYVKNVKRFHTLKLQEIDDELVNVMLFGQISLLDYGRRCVDGFFDEEEEEEEEEEIEIEVISYEESNQYIKMTSFDEVTDWLESQGYNLVRIVGSHHIYKNGSHSVPVPLHKGKDFNKFLAYTIQKEVLKVS